MNQDLAKKLAAKIETLTKLHFAITDLNGNILAKSSGFEAEKNPLKVKKHKGSLALKHKGKEIGYIYFKEKDKLKDIEKLLSSVAELYINQFIFLDDMPLTERHLDKFAYDLLNGGKDEDTLFVEAKALGIDLTLPRVAIAVMIGGEMNDLLNETEIAGEEREEQISRLKRKIASSIDSFYTRHRNNIVAYVGENVFAVLKDIGDEENISKNLEHFKNTINSIHYIVRNEVRNPVTIGVGGYYDGNLGLKQSFGEAIFTARLGEQIWGEDKMYHFDSFGVVAPLVQGIDESRKNYSQDLFSKFSNREEALRTLNTFFDADMSLTKTAYRLKIHRNTLVYRLDKITETLNLDPRIFDDAVQIKLALLFTNFITGAKV